VRRLLAGERVTMHGRHVHLDDVRLDQPPSPLPPLLAGVRGPESMPPEWWTELAPIGTLDDARTHIEALETAGAGSIGLFPAPDVTMAMGQVGDVLALARR